jgi:hypothetical protein
LLRSRVRKFRRDLWITLYFTCCQKQIKNNIQKKSFGKKMYFVFCKYADNFPL